MHTNPRLPTIAAFVVLLACTAAEPVQAQKHFENCASNAEHNAVLIFPEDANLTVNGRAVAEGDEIAVFDSEGNCAGFMVWNGPKSALTMWGDDAVTETKDGLAGGELFQMRLWRSASDEEFREEDGDVEISLDSCSGPPCHEAREYRADVVYKLAGLNAFRAGPDDEMPESFGLAHPYPNPFNPQTTFTIVVEEDQHVTVRVFNTLGREVAKIYDGEMTANSARQFSFEASNLASGLYFIRAEGEHFADVHSVTLAK